MSFVKSQLVTGYDNTPTLYRPNQPGRTVKQLAWYKAGATDATTVTYRMVRVPTNAVISKVEVALELNGGTATTFTGNIGLYWSDNGPVDGTSPIYSGSATAVSTSFFAYQLAMAGFTGATGFSDVTFRNVAGNSATDGFYVPSASYLPLWDALSSGGAQGTVSAGAGAYPESSLTANWSGQGAVSSTSNAFYQLNADPGGFLDICFTATTTTSLSAAMYFVMAVSFVVYN